VTIGEMPLSILTVRALGDMGYSINPSGADPYTIFAGNVRADDSQSARAPLPLNWEMAFPIRPIVLPSHRSAASSSLKAAK
jgi:hypothetical protein